MKCTVVGPVADATRTSPLIDGQAFYPASAAKRGSATSQTFFPPSVEEMSTSFKSIEEELRSQYALTYTPADFKANGEFRAIYLYCNDRRYIARAKKGYFAPKE